MGSRLIFSLLLCLSSHSPLSQVAEQGPKPVVLQQGEGEVRIRRPRQNPLPSSQFLVKVSPRTNGSKHMLVGSEEIQPGAVIPRHKHHGEEEILLLQTGNAHVWLGGKEYEARPGSLVFIPADTWVSLKNTGTENINLLFVFNEPGFEDMLLCASVPRGAPALPISNQEVAACYQHGDAELESASSHRMQK